MDDSRMNVFLDRFYPDNTEFLEQLEKEARMTNVPVIRRTEQSTLKFCLDMKKPRTVLEIGTAIGFSSVFICTYSDASVTTIENYQKRIPIARENFRKSGFEDRITLLEGDAGQILKTLNEPFDLIFMDAAKGQYITWLPDVLRLLKPGGLLISDNILQEDEILESRFQVERRQRTIHKRMREYIEALMSCESLTSTVLPIGDGLALSKKSESIVGEEKL